VDRLWQVVTSIVLALVGSAAWGQNAVLLTGDSWTGVPGWPSLVFYDEFLQESTSVNILANLAEGGRALAINTYFSPTLPSLRDDIGAQLAGYTHGEIDFVVITVGGNDFILRPDATSFEGLRDAAIYVSAAIVDAGAKPIWNGIPVVPYLRQREWFPDYEGMLLNYNRWLRNFCRVNGYAFIDLDSAFIAADGGWRANDEDESYGEEDGVHYSPAGAAYLATMIESAIVAADQLQPAIAAQIDIQPVPPATALRPENTGGEVPDDSIRVSVISESTALGDLVDLDATDIDPATLAFGPAEGSFDPASTPAVEQDIDGDGMNDGAFNFLMSGSGITCDDKAATLIGELASSGQVFIGMDTIDTDCADNTCH